MFEITRSKKLPYTSDFIQYGLNESKRDRVTIWTAPGCAFGTVLSLAIPIQAFLTAQGWDIAKAFAWIFLSPALVAIVMALINAAIFVPRNRKNRDLNRKLEILEPYRIALEQRRLHRDLDQTLAQLIESACFHWSSIHRELGMGIWNEPDLSTSLTETKRDALRAADITMYEALTLSLRGFAPNGHKSSVKENLVESFSELNLEGVLDGFKQVLKGEKGYSSPEAPTVVPMVIELTSKLKSLNEQIWQLTNKDRANIGAKIAADIPGQSIDHVLRQMTDLEVAKKELDGEMHNQNYH